MCKEETSGYTTKEKCEDWPRQECTVVKKKVTKFTTMTGCNKEPTELCAPAGCGFREGAEECHDVVKTHIQEKPEEECTLEPVKTCKHITRLVPKEICNRSKQNPRKVKKPIIKNWCYTPSEDQDHKYPLARISKKIRISELCELNTESQDKTNSNLNLKKLKRRDLLNFVNKSLNLSSKR